MANENDAVSAVYDIAGIQLELDELDLNASKEKAQVESKYYELKKPFFQKRDVIINKIDNFWTTVLSKHPGILRLFTATDEDQDCLFYLRKLVVDKSYEVVGVGGYQIKFIFNENPYFEPLELIKTLDLRPYRDPSFEHTEINWKLGMNLVDKWEQKSVLEGAGMKRKWCPNTSFFSWFVDDSQSFLSTTIQTFFVDEAWELAATYYNL